MLPKALFAVLASLCCLPMLFSAESVKSQGVKLQYKAGYPVEMVTTHTIAIEQLIPGLDFNTYGKQIITSWLTLNTGDSVQLLTKPPFTLAWTLKNLEIDLTSNGMEIVYDSRLPQKSLLAKELAKWVNRTLKLTINENLSLNRNSPELDEFVKKYPTIRELDPYTLLEGQLLPMFALAGNELTAGSVITKTNLRGYLGLAFSALTYEIKEITARQVVAGFKGSIEPRIIPLKGVGDIEKAAGFVQLSLAGDVKGTVSWDRMNALLCQIVGDYEFRAHLKIASMEWPLTVKIKSSLETVPASILVSSPQSPAAIP